MAKISEKNRRFRSKDEIVRDLVQVLNMDLAYGTKFAVVAEALWVWSEFDGKHKECRFWSENALKLFKSSGRRNLIHEHVVPRREMLAKFNFQEPKKKFTERGVRLLLNRFCVGCVVTKDEDTKLNRIGLKSRMPDNWDKKNVWARYDEAKINRIDTKRK